MNVNRTSKSYALGQRMRGHVNKGTEFSVAKLVDTKNVVVEFSAGFVEGPAKVAGKPHYVLAQGVAVAA